MVYQPILGEGTSHCVPQDVSGSQRHLFFSSHSSTLSHSDPQFVLDTESESYRESFNEPTFTNIGTQTNDEEYWKAKRIHTNLLKIKSKEQDITDKANVRRKQLREQKRTEELSLPPVTDKESLMAYRIFLEENEKKEFMIREEELEEQMKLKFEMITKSLHARYHQGETRKEQRVEAMRERSKHSKKIKTSQKLKAIQSNGNAEMVNGKSRFTDNHSIAKRKRIIPVCEQKSPSIREQNHHRKSLELLHSKLN